MPREGRLVTVEDNWKGEKKGEEGRRREGGGRGEGGGVRERRGGGREGSSRG